MMFPKFIFILAALINIIFGLIAIVVGLIFIGVFQDIFKGFYNLSEPSILNTLGIGFFTSGFLVIAIPALLIGAVYIFLGVKGLKTQRKLSLFMAAVAIMVSIFFLLDSSRIGMKEGQRQNSELALQNQKIITSAGITSSNTTGLDITYNFSEGTQGMYLIQTEISTNEQLYFNSLEQSFSEKESNFTNKISFSEIFSTCQAQSDNWICVGLTNENASPENIEIMVTTKMNLVEANSTDYTVVNSQNILIPDAKFSFELTPDSTLEDIRIVN